MPSVSNIAAQTLQRQIFSSHYQPGSALPPQRELSESLGISRASLREAISMLEALGLLRSHPGKGVFVTSGIRSSPGDLPVGPGAMPLAEIYQLRYVIEPSSASLAAQRRADLNLDQLTESLTGMHAALTTCDLVTAAEEDLCFHRQIAELSGNPGLKAITEQFKEQLAFSLRLPFADRVHIWQTYDEHQAILDAITSGNSKDAFHSMQRHLLGASNRVGISFLQP